MGKEEQMQKIITATGREITVLWCGLSSIDAVLRFAVTGQTMADVLTIFTDPKETAVLTHVFDEHRTVFNGYTKFKGVDMKPDGSIVVALMEE